MSLLNNSIGREKLLKTDLFSLCLSVCLRHKCLEQTKIFLTWWWYFSSGHENVSVRLIKYPKTINKATSCQVEVQIVNNTHLQWGWSLAIPLDSWDYNFTLCDISATGTKALRQNESPKTNTSYRLMQHHGKHYRPEIWHLQLSLASYDLCSPLDWFHFIDEET